MVSGAFYRAFFGQDKSFSIFIKIEKKVSSEDETINNFHKI